MAFLLVSLSYFVWAFLNLRLVSEIKEGVSALELKDLLVFSTASIYIYMILAMVGFIILAYTALKIENPSAFLLITLISIAGLILSGNKTAMLSIASSFLLLFIFSRYYLE